LSDDHSPVTSLDEPVTARWPLLPMPITSIVVAATWIFLVNSVHPGHLLVAVVLGWLIPLFTHRFLPVPPKVRSWGALIAFAPVFAWDLVVANVVVALILIRVGYKPRCAWLAIPLDLRDPYAITTLAAVISLTPGTVSSRLTADRRVLLVHALDTGDPAGDIATIKRRYEEPIRRMFEG
jgi:multicomponent K+:H+ antiporter subunit E